VLRDAISGGLGVVRAFVDARVHEGGDADLFAFGEAVGVPGRIARIEVRRVHRVLGVQMEFPEERLPQGLEVIALRARLGALEGEVFRSCHGQAREQQ
jgi:hypothetical protein